MMKQIIIIALVMSMLAIPAMAASANYNPGEYIAVLRFTIPDWWGDCGAGCDDWGYADYGDLGPGAYYVINNTDNRVFSTTSTVKPIARDDGFELLVKNETFTITQYDYAVFPIAGKSTNVTPNAVQNGTIASMTVDKNTVDRWQLWGLYEDIEYYLINGTTLLETQVGDANGLVNFTTNLIAGQTYTVTSKPFVVVYAFDAETLGSISTFNTTFNGSAKTTTEGYILHDNQSLGTFTLITGADGYITDTRSIEVTEPTSVIVLLEKVGSVYTGRHMVRFVAQKTFGGVLPGTYVSVSGNISAPNANVSNSLVQGTTRTVYANGYETTYVTTSLSGTTMTGGNIAVMSGTTGTDGAITFQMYENVAYSMIFTTPSNGAQTFNVYPKESTYYIYFSPFAIKPNDPIGDSITSYWTQTRINSETGYVNLTYADVSNSTTALEYWINYTNGSTYQYVAVGTPNAYTNSVVVPANNATYVVQIKATSTTAGTINRLTTLVFHQGRRISFGFAEDWHYAVLAFLSIAFMLGLFGAVNVHIGAVLAVIMAWFWRWAGWFDTGSTNTLLLMLATLIAIFYAMRKGEVTKI